MKLNKRGKNDACFMGVLFLCWFNSFFVGIFGEIFNHAEWRLLCKSKRSQSSFLLFGFCMCEYEFRNQYVTMLDVLKIIHIYMNTHNSNFNKSVCFGNIPIYLLIYFFIHTCIYEL